MQIYFDNAATTSPNEKIVDQLAKDMMEYYANPSSLHQFAAKSRKLIEQSELDIINVLGLRDRKVIFTSGATESTNLAIKGVLEKSEDPSKISIVTTVIEHPCVSEVFRYYEKRGVETVYAPVNQYGQVDDKFLLENIKTSTKLVSLIWVNNEFGAIQNIADLSKRIKSINPRVLIHVDAVQGFGKVKDDFSQVDMISISGHKFHAPKGIGALIIRKDLKLMPQILGGGQQNNQRSGTVNAPLIAALGNTCSYLDANHFEEIVRPMQLYLINKLATMFGESALNIRVKESNYAPHIINLSFEGLKGEVILHMLEEDAIYISNASACSSHQKESKSALKNIGCSKARIDGAIRISLSEYNTYEEINIFLDHLDAVITRLKQLFRK